ncbi:unnamed protein product [Prunus armeniaca]|uniref:Uncharacterized protein n=1 Tax=Prunus armeniaca TaxID=36596 RepID=A0A6J5V8G5_PRUAR|nr:unnamed protein product [Prunus armeniaca]
MWPGGEVGDGGLGGGKHTAGDMGSSGRAQGAVGFRHRSTVWATRESRGEKRTKKQPKKGTTRAK